MKDTKNTENSFNYLHFLANYIGEKKEKETSSIYGFVDDLKHMPKACRGNYLFAKKFIDFFNICFIIILA